MAWAHNSCSRGPKIHKVDWRSEQLGLGPWLPFGGATQVPTTYVITYKCNHLANGHGFGLVRKGFLCRCGKCPHTSQLVKKRVSYGLGKVPKSCHSGPNHAILAPMAILAWGALLQTSQKNGFRVPWEVENTFTEKSEPEAMAIFSETGLEGHPPSPDLAPTWQFGALGSF
jgi:hypothetical protein